MNKNLSNKLIKAIYNSEYKDNFILEGSYALYGVILKDIKDKNIKLRKLSISDLDVDIYEELDKLYKQSNSVNNNFIDFMNSELQIMINKIIKISKIKHYTYELIKSSISKREGNNTSWYYAKIKLDFNNPNELFNKQKVIELDINFVGDKLNKKKYTIRFGDSYIDVYVYDNEKYLANKLMAFNKHYNYYKDSKTEKQKLGNLRKLKQDYFDILQIKKYLFIDSFLVDKYLLLMGCQFNYKEYYNKIQEKVKEVILNNDR